MDWQKLQLAVKLTPSRCALNKYGGGTIPNLGSATLKITYHGRSTLADFKIVDVPNSSSILGCKHALELRLITLNANSLNVTPWIDSINIIITRLSKRIKSTTNQNQCTRISYQSECGEEPKIFADFIF